ncbi:hypothetical protein DND90_33190 [Pseudomonas syringae pv. maculicola]|nr:hypothetical protein DND90_33190 [Pseudomonas syringae pv. maculicola]
MSDWLLLAVLCRSWLQSVLVKSDAIGGENECKRLFKWSAISQTANPQSMRSNAVQSTDPIMKKSADVTAALGERCITMYAYIVDP